MPIHSGKDKTGLFIQWGTTGKKYYYNPQDEKSKEQAQKKAEKQQTAIYSSGWKGDREMKMKLLRVVKKGDDQRQNRLDDLQQDIWALQGAAHSINNLSGYLSVHFNGTNKQPWRDRVLTNARNEVRDAINEAVSSEVKKLLDDILKCYGRIKPEKDSLKSAIDRLKEITPKVLSFINKCRKEEQDLGGKN